MTTATVSQTDVNAVLAQVAAVAGGSTMTETQAPQAQPQAQTQTANGATSAPTKAPKAKKAPKAPRAAKADAPPRRGDNSATVVVSMKTGLRGALQNAANFHLKSLSGMAAHYILEGLKRDGLLPGQQAAVLQAAQADTATQPKALLEAEANTNTNTNTNAPTSKTFAHVPTAPAEAQTQTQPQNNNALSKVVAPPSVNPVVKVVSIPSAPHPTAPGGDKIPF